MKILIVIPSDPEYAGICKTFPRIKSLNRRLYRTFSGSIMADILVPGGGSPSMIYHLAGRLASTTYDLVVLAGICGTYQEDIPIGRVVRIKHDRFANFGAGSPDGFLPADKLGFLPADELWSARRMDDDPGPALGFVENLPSLEGITVETASGTIPVIGELRERYTPGTESMEGAAFFYVCRHENLNFVQLRAISNRVEVRNRSNWQTGPAFDNLAVAMNELIESLHG